jgi:aspartyl-tRNA(Asn)/glutamyl-tRNA(Gln) amidotransferase subunit A
MKLYLNDICTVPANIAGLPAVSVPCAENADGLPVGVQLLGRRFDDARLLAFARALEREISGGETV